MIFAGSGNVVWAVNVSDVETVVGFDGEEILTQSVCAVVD
jgi:hypothetical protein